MSFQAQVPETLAKGLGGQTKIEKPMVFTFPELGVHTMWMKGMLVPIDIVWADERGVITKVYHNCPTHPWNRKYSSITPSKYAIECAAGEARRLGLDVGNQIRILRK
jgi:hypothetical protein